MTIKGDKTLSLIRRALISHQHKMTNERDNLFGGKKDPTDQLLIVENELKNVDSLLTAVNFNIDRLEAVPCGQH